MAKDYAKKSKNKKSASVARSKPLRQQQVPAAPKAWAWVVCGLLIGLFTIAIFFLKNIKTHDETTLTAIPLQIKHNPTLSKKTTAPKVATSSAPEDYDFYTILPEMKVWAPTQAANDGQASPHNNSTQALKSKIKLTTKQTSHQTAKLLQAAAGKSMINNKIAYAIQVAAFKQLSDADKLKTKLISQGYNTSVKIITNNGKNWYRVIIGPYTNQSAAIKTKQQLANNHLGSWIVKTPTSSSK